MTSRPASEFGKRRSRTRSGASRCRRRRSPATASSTSATRAATSRAARDRCTRSTPRPARSSGSSSWCPGSRATWSADRWARRRSTHRRGKTRPASRSAVADLDVLHARYQDRAAVRPRRQSGARFRDRRARGRQPFTDSVVVLDAKTGDYKNHFKIVPKDWHDWDVSNPPILIQTMGGKQLMAVAPKDGYLYGFDLANNSLLYRVPVTRVEDVAETFSPGTVVHFCPGSVGGAEWNSPAYDPKTNLIIVGEVEWCETVTAEGCRKSCGREDRSAMGRDRRPSIHSGMFGQLRQDLGGMGSRRRRRHRRLEVAPEVQLPDRRRQ